MPETRAKERKPSERPDAGDRRPVAGSHWEWIAAVVSLLLVLGALAFLVFQAVDAPRSAPSIRVEIDSIVRARDGYLVEFRAHNAGAATAAGLQIEGVLRSDTAEVETSEVTLDYVPGESSRAGGLFFTRDPRQLRLEIRPTGYEQP